MAEAPSTLDGWFTFHDFRSIRWDAWKSADSATRSGALAELGDFVDTETKVQLARAGSFGQYAIAGHKADLLFLYMRPTIQELVQLKNRFNHTKFADFTTSPYSYVSVVELGGYLAKPGVDPETDPYLQSRLKPEIPPHSHVCFYPMNKKRDGVDNWYMLSPGERQGMMRSHGEIGRNYAQTVKQIITGSMGLDDWEWGVTLFAEDPLQFKKIVYEMRFDEVSARFGEFGPFLMGTRASQGDIERMMNL